MANWTLGGLSNPLNNNQPIDISGMPTDSLLAMLEQMVFIRAAERRIAKGREEKLIGGPVHLGVGQEAIAVGVAANLRKSDRIFSGHRSHAHLLAMGGDQRRLFSEVLGRANGHSRGMGGSMHLWDEPNGFYGAVPIVAGTVPLAVGAGLAAKLMGSDDIGVAYLGDGAVEEGVVNESLNLAQTLKAPVLFVVENNLFASHMHISERQHFESTARYADANGVAFEVVDGNDLVAVKSAAQRLIQRARSGEGPGFLEAVTYRWYGHVDWREDIDVGIERSAQHLAAWRARDPVGRLVTALAHRDPDLQSAVDRMQNEIERTASTDWDLALSDPYPQEASILQHVYSNVAGLQ